MKDYLWETSNWNVIMYDIITTYFLNKKKKENSEEEIL